jgi:hypothetical protein
MKKAIPLPRPTMQLRTYYYNKSNTNIVIPSLPYDSYTPYRYEFFLNDMRSTINRIQNDYKYSMHCDQIHMIHQEKLYRIHQEHMFNIQRIHHTYNNAC